MTGDITVHAPAVLPLPNEFPAPKGVHNLPRPDPHQFVGRSAEMDTLEQALGPKKERAATQVVTQAMSGLGGVGKSTLALHYAHVHRDSYTLVWWINAETSEAITDSLAQLTRRVNSGINTSTTASTDLAQWALAWLEAHAGWLLVFDNATDPNDIAPYLARLTGGDHLITSRRTHGWHDLATHPLHLNVLTPPEATRLLCHLAGRNQPDEHAAARGLADELGHLPLALEQAGAHIRRTRGTYSGYLERFRTQTARMLSTPGDGDPHGATIARTWRITLDTIAERDRLAVHLLRVMAWLAANDIPRDLLSGFADEPGAEDDALALLNDFSMINLTEDAAAAHRLVQVVARTADATDPHRSEQAIHEAHCAVATALRNALPSAPETNFAEWPRWRALLPHIDVYLTHTPPDSDTADTELISYYSSRFLCSQGRLGQATKYAQRSASASARLHGRDHPHTLASRNNLATTFQAAGDLRRAIPLFEQTLAEREQVLGHDDRSTLQSRNNLAHALQEAGDLGRGVSLFEQTLAACERVLGHDHPDTLVSRNNLATTFQAAGDLRRAIPLFEQTLAEREQVLGHDHPDTLNSRNNLAHAYRTVGDLGRAIPLFEQTLAEREQVLGHDHPSTLNSRNNLAHAFQEAGNLGRAIPLHEQTLAACERVLGHDHPDTLASRNNLAGAFQAAGDLDRAIPIHEQTLAKRELVLGYEHPDTLISRNNLAGAFQVAGDLDRAIPIHEENLADCERILGRDHPFTRIVRGNLAQAQARSNQR
ncbi:tetratricopeptide repeat protein [Streptomyces sp. 8N616]|uniref:tetratricopeptide repeat protein n=1 Tax=Streptomyces sp. 8N616 TaxID=3457414 RepID=UPI003FCFA772